MSRMMKVMVALLAIAVMAAPAFAGTVFDADGFKYNLDGDLQIQFNNNGNDDEDMAIEYDDLEIKNNASYQVSDDFSVYGQFDFSGNGAGAGGGDIAFEEAYLGGAYQNFSFRYGNYDNTLDDFGVEAAYEGDFNGDVFDAIGVANGGGNSIEAAVTFADMVTVTLGHELDANADTDTFTFVNVGFTVAGVDLTVAYVTAEDTVLGIGEEFDGYAISAAYDFGVVAVGADYSYAEEDNTDEEYTFYNVVVSAPVTEKASVAVGFNSEDYESDDTYDTFYVNGSYALASGAKVFAEVIDSDYVDDTAYTVGMQVKF